MSLLKSFQPWNVLVCNDSKCHFCHGEFFYGWGAPGRVKKNVVLRNIQNYSIKNIEYLSCRPVVLSPSYPITHLFCRPVISSPIYPVYPVTQLSRRPVIPSPSFPIAQFSHRPVVPSPSCPVAQLSCCPVVLSPNWRRPLGVAQSASPRCPIPE